MSKDAVNLYWWGKEHLDAKEYDEALKCFDEAIKLDPDNAEFHVEKGNLLAMQGKNIEALHCYDKAIDINPRSADAWKYKGDVYMVLGRYGEALRCFDEVTKLDPNNEIAWLCLGNLHQDMRSLQKALACYNKALELNPGSKEAATQKLVIEKQLGMVTETPDVAAETPAAMPSNKPVRKLIKKVCLLGDPAVGKTSLIRRFVLDLFEDKYISTIGAKVREKTLQLKHPDTEENVELTLMLWDIAGHTLAGNIHPTYYRGAEGAFLVSDITRKDTLDALYGWVDEIHEIAGDISYVFIANKSDLENKEFGIAALNDIAPGHGAPQFITSAKTGENVEMAFAALGELLLSS